MPAGVDRTVALPPARRIRPMIDSRTPSRSPGHIVWVEARSAVAHVHVDGGCGPLDVDRHLSGRVTCGVEHRLTGRRGDLAARALRGLARRDDIHADGEVQLEGGGVVAQIGRQVAVGGRIAVV